MTNKKQRPAQKRTETDRQRIFIDEYLACWNASEAARRAGYSRRSAGSIGHENLKKPEIQAAIEARLAEKHISADEVLAMLADIAHADMREFVRVNRAGEPIGFNLRPGRPLHLVKKVSVTDRGTSIELYDRLTALIKIGEYHKLFVQQHELSGKNGQPIFDMENVKNELVRKFAEVVTEGSARQVSSQPQPE
jgi:phage terminase small subunit